MNTNPIQRRKLYHEVFDRLMVRIKEGEFAPGTHLPSERDLMDTYCVGRPAIREALQQLESCGLVTITHGERARVVMPTAKAMVNRLADTVLYMLEVSKGSVTHLKQVRLLLETGLVRMAAERCDQRDLDLLEQCLDEHKQATSESDDFVERDMAFHVQIATISGNPILSAATEGILDWLKMHHQAVVQFRGAEKIALQEHQKIFDAIKAQDPDEAAKIMAIHLNRTNPLWQNLY